MKISPNEPCPCSSGRKYKKCCRRFHQGSIKVSKPEELVRARWSAYALELPDYIMKTTHPENPDYDENFARWRVRIEAYCIRNSFEALEILSAEEDKVTYRAEILAFMSRPTVITEDSVFKQKDGEWLYLDGEVNQEESEIKDE